MQPTEIARKMCEDVYGKGNVELIKQLVADDAISHDPFMGRTDRAGVEMAVQGYRRAFPDMKMEVLDVIGSGDKAVIRWRSTGTHKGELFGIQPSNKKVTLEGMSEIHVANGKIKEAWDHFDTLGLMRQIGAVPESMMPMARPDGGGRAAAQQPQQPRR